MKAIPVMTPCSNCGCRSRLWEVRGAHTWHTICFACRRYREWTKSGGTRFSTVPKNDADKREKKFKRGLKNR